MALSNIFREPRREIIESIVGTILVFGLIFCDYLFGTWWQHHLEVTYPDAHNPDYWRGFWVAGMFIGAASIALAYPVLFLFPHFVGELVCNGLNRAGIELRPKRRY